MADTYTMHLKSQHYHWNVSCPFFDSLHTFFEKICAELHATIDVSAQHIRALGAQRLGRAFS